MKILLTGDLHLGKSYAKYPDIARPLSEARLRALQNVVDAANREACDFFVIAGDLYDKTSGIGRELHQAVCRLLGEFSGQAVLVLPGNHDSYTDDKSPLWRDFEACAALGVEVVSRPIATVEDGYVRHHSVHLARELVLLHAERSVRIAGDRFGRRDGGYRMEGTRITERGYEDEKE